MIDRRTTMVIKLGLYGIGGVVGLAGLSALITYVLVRECLQRSLV